MTPDVCGASVIARARKWSLHLDIFSSSVTVRATKIYIKMEEKSQAAERDTMKDEAHEKDARNKRYVANGRLASPVARGSVCGAAVAKLTSHFTAPS